MFRRAIVESSRCGIGVIWISIMLSQIKHYQWTSNMFAEEREEWKLIFNDDVISLLYFECSYYPWFHIGSNAELNRVLSNYTQKSSGESFRANDIEAHRGGRRDEIPWQNDELESEKLKISLVKTENDWEKKSFGISILIIHSWLD